MTNTLPKVLVGLTMALSVLTAPLLVSTATPAGASATPTVYPCHNDTSLANNFTGQGSKTVDVNRNDPNVGLNASTKPNPQYANGGYYYLDVKACGPTAHVLVTANCWSIEFGTGLSRVNGTVTYKKVIMSAVDLTFPTTPGQTYFLRVQNADMAVVTDVSSIDSPAP